MASGDEPRDWISEDEALLAEIEGDEAARASVASGRAKRQQIALERRSQLERICDVYSVSTDGGYHDLRIQVFNRVVGYVNEHVWRDSLADAHRRSLGENLSEWREMREMRDDIMGGHGGTESRIGTFNEEALFLPDRQAIAGMSLRREEAVARAQAHLDAEGSRLVALNEKDASQSIPGPLARFPSRPRTPVRDAHRRRRDRCAGGRRGLRAQLPTSEADRDSRDDRPAGRRMGLRDLNLWVISLWAGRGSPIGPGFANRSIRVRPSGGLRWPAKTACCRRSPCARSRRTGELPWSRGGGRTAAIVSLGPSSPRA